MTIETHGLWHSLVETARHAPSPHNVQPWRLNIVSDDLAELYIDGARTLPMEDTTGAFLLSAMAMFIEAIDLLAAPLGRRLETKLHSTTTEIAGLVSRPTAPALIPFASLELVPAPAADAVYSPEVFLARRTSRIPFRSTPVTPSAVEALACLAETWGHRYTHVVQTAHIDSILARNIGAVFDDMNQSNYHDELTGWFRFTERATRTHRDGLDWRCMNMSRGEFWLSAKLPRLLVYPPTRSFLARRYRKQLGPVPAIGILSGEFFDPANAMDSGRLLLHFWLELTRLGLYLHPYGNLVTNPDAARWLEGLTAVPKAWLVFKVGHSDIPPRSQRRAVADILISNKAVFSK